MGDLNLNRYQIETSFRLGITALDPNLRIGYLFIVIYSHIVSLALKNLEQVLVLCLSVAYLRVL